MTSEITDKMLSDLDAIRFVVAVLAPVAVGILYNIARIAAALENRK